MDGLIERIVEMERRSEGTILDEAVKEKLEEKRRELEEKRSGRASVQKIIDEYWSYTLQR